VRQTRCASIVLSSGSVLVSDYETGYLVVSNKITGANDPMSVLYTPAQVRSATSITQETYRHWKKALVPMRKHRGQSPSYTSGDLLAISVVRVLCVDMGFRVSAITNIAELLFDICNSAPWPTLERGNLCLDLANREAEFRQTISESHADAPYIVVPLRVVIARLRAQLLPVGDEQHQHTLQFPPLSIRDTPTNVRMRRRT
jgi:hypothetical protein